jgi:hypothetical protein
MQITYTLGTSITSQGAAFTAQYQTAVNAAIQFLEHAFTNNVTLNLDFEWSSLGAGVGANNSGPAYSFSYSQVLNALKASAHSADDNAGYGTLPLSDPVGSGSDFAVTQGEAKVLGLNFGTGSTFDATVRLNSDFGTTGWTFDPNNRAVSGKLDAIGALEHEITEFAMGRIGALGTYIFSGSFWTPLDLFRTNASGRVYTPGPGSFSIDGVHLLQTYNDPTHGGDAVDWLGSIQGDSFGTLYSGVADVVTPVDMREMDLLGWTRAPATFDDFTGDAVSAILYRNASTGDVGYRAMNGGVGTWHDIGGSVSYNVVGTGDFDGNYAADILYQNASGDTAYYANTLDGTPGTWVDLGIISTAYKVVAVGDLNGDGVSDIVFQATSGPTTGDVGYSIITNGHLGTWHDLGTTTYTVVGVGDFLGNGVIGILFQNQAGNGDVGYSVSGVWHDIGPTSYTVVGVGDFTGSGASGVLYQNGTSGDVGYFEQGAWHDIGIPAAGYKVVSVGDYNGGLTTDILYENQTTGDTGYLALPVGGGPGTWVDLGTTSSVYSILNFGGDDGAPTGAGLFGRGLSWFADPGQASPTLGYTSVSPGGPNLTAVSSAEPFGSMADPVLPSSAIALVPVNDFPKHGFPV